MVQLSHTTYTSWILIEVFTDSWNSKQNLSQYHAKIDGASKQLTDKTESLTLVNIEVVEKASNHAEDLEKQAAQLERYVWRQRLTN